jgi:hypothetical protein
MLRQHAAAIVSTFPSHVCSHRNCRTETGAQYAYLIQSSQAAMLVVLISAVD